MKLPRPYIPLGVQIRVAERQFKDKYGHAPAPAERASPGLPLKEHLRRLLHSIFEVQFTDGNANYLPPQKVHLHHRPALCNREFKNGRYYPDANDPGYLVYLPADNHDIETRVRGQRGAYADLALRRKRKRVERKRKRPRSRLRGRGFDKSRTRHFDGRVTPRHR